MNAYFDTAIIFNETIGCRTLDLLHVAVALTLGVKTFVSFDERQRAVAKLGGYPKSS